jgi:hypothetical protein
LTAPESLDSGSAERWVPRDANPGDRPALTAVFNDAFHRRDTPELLDWRYDKNPHGRAWTVVAAAPDGSLAGAYSYVPRKFEIGGARSLVMQASDAMVFPRWQRKGIFRGLDDLLAARAADAKIPFGFAFCGRRSQKGFLDNGWVPIAKYRTWTRVLRVAGAAFDARKSDGRARRLMVPLEALRARAADGKIRAMLESFSDAPVAGAGAEANTTIAAGRSPSTASLAAIAGAAREMAAGNCGVAGARPIVAVRDAEYLDWRYLRTPRRTHGLFQLLRSGSVAGYYDVEHREGRGYLLDVCGVDDAARAAAIAAAVERLRSLGAAAIQTTVVEGSWLDRVIRNFGFEPPAEKDLLPFIVRVFTPGPAADAALDPRNWYILDGDRDAEGMA